MTNQTYPSTRITVTYNHVTDVEKGGQKDLMVGIIQRKFTVILDPNTVGVLTKRSFLKSICVYFRKTLPVFVNPLSCSNVLELKDKRVELEEKHTFGDIIRIVKEEEKDQENEMLSIQLLLTKLDVHNQLDFYCKKNSINQEDIVFSISKRISITIRDKHGIVHNCVFLIHESKTLHDLLLDLFFKLQYPIRLFPGKVFYQTEIYKFVEYLSGEEEKISVILPNNNRINVKQSLCKNLSQLGVEADDTISILID